MNQGDIDLVAGMQVVGSDGEHVGAVKRIRSTDFLLDLRFWPDIYIPFRAIRSVEEDRIILLVGSGEIENIGYR